MDLAQVGDRRAALELLGRQLVHRGEDRRHRDVDPDIDRAELLLHPVGGGIDGLRVGDVRGDRQGADAEAAEFRGRVLQAVRVARQQRDIAAVAREFGRGGAADSGAGPGDDDDLAHGRSLADPAATHETTRRRTGISATAPDRRLVMRLIQWHPNRTEG
jgi:hypothetical protein